MNKRENSQTDLFQILNSCLRSFKRKIVVFIKISLRQKSHSSLQEIYEQLIVQINQAKKKILILTQSSFTFNQDSYLFQRFVGRVRQIIRMYLPQATISEDIFLYLKKIQNYTIKQDVDFLNYVVFLFKQVPKFIKRKIQTKQINLKNSCIDDQSQFQQKIQLENQRHHVLQKESFVKYPNYQINQEQFSTRRLNQKQKNRQIIKFQQPHRPIDILQKSVKNFECFDCDISQYRTNFFQLVQNKQLAFSQIQNLMLNSNKVIKETILQYSKSFNRYKTRILKNPNYRTIQCTQRCLTANAIKRQLNFTNLSCRNNQTSSKLKNFKFIQKNKHYQTIVGLDMNDLEKTILQRQIMNRRNNVLKLKNISLTGQGGHLQLSAEKPTKYHHRLTYRQNNNNNLKKKYQMFLKKQKNYESQFKIQGTLKTLEHYQPYKTQKVLHNTFFQTLNPEKTLSNRNKIK